MRCEINGFVYDILSVFSLLFLLMPGVSSPIYQKIIIYIIYIICDILTTILEKSRGINNTTLSELVSL